MSSYKDMRTRASNIFVDIGYYVLLLGYSFLMVLEVFYPGYFGNNIYTVMALFFLFCLIPPPSVQDTIFLLLGKRIRASKRIFPHTEQCVYLLQRGDGVLKIGRTVNLTKRLKDLKRDYENDFEIIYLWQCNDLSRVEAVALNSTKDFEYQEESRVELRLGNPDLLIDIVNKNLRDVGLL